MDVVNEEVEAGNIEVEDVGPCEENHYTGDMLKRLKENHNYTVYKSSNKNSNGKRFEKIVQIYLQKEYDFKIFDLEYRKEDYMEIDIFAESMPLRILRKDVSMSTVEDILNKNVGNTTEIKRISKTEFVLEIWNAYPTEDFPLSSFDEDGCLRIRVECKTQSVEGSADKKIPGCIFDLRYGSEQSNIILLMSGSYYNDYHYQLAEFFSSDSWVNKHCPIPETNMIVMNERDFTEWCCSAMNNK